MSAIVDTGLARSRKSPLRVRHHSPNGGGTHSCKPLLDGGLPDAWPRRKTEAVDASCAIQAGEEASKCALSQRVDSLVGSVTVLQARADRHERDICALRCQMERDVAAEAKSFQATTDRHERDISEIRCQIEREVVGLGEAFEKAKHLQVNENAVAKLREELLAHSPQLQIDELAARIEATTRYVENMDAERIGQSVESRLTQLNTLACRIEETSRALQSEKHSRHEFWSTLIGESVQREISLLSGEVENRIRRAFEEGPAWQQTAVMQPERVEALASSVDELRRWLKDEQWARVELRNELSEQWNSAIQEKLHNLLNSPRLLADHQTKDRKTGRGTARVGEIRLPVESSRLTHNQLMANFDRRQTDHLLQSMAADVAEVRASLETDDLLEISETLSVDSRGIASVQSENLFSSDSEDEEMLEVGNPRSKLAGAKTNHSCTGGQHSPLPARCCRSTAVRAMFATETGR